MSRQMQEIVIGNIKGVKGDRGEQGIQGEPFKYEDFTPEQLEALKVKGDKGDKGDAFTYADFTPEQLESLKGPAPVRGVDYWTESDKSEIVNDVLASIPNYNEESF